MPLEQFLGEAQFAAHLAHFVLVEEAERLDDALGFHQPLDAGHAVVVGLDHRRLGRAAGFDRVGIDGALPENPVVVQEVVGLDGALLHPNELLADDPPLLFRIRDAAQRRQELAARVLHHEGAAAVPENAAHEIGLALAHQAGVHVDPPHPLAAERAQAEREGHRGIDAAADEEEDVAALRPSPGSSPRSREPGASGSSPGGSRRRGTGSWRGSPCPGGCAPPPGGTGPRTGASRACAMAATRHVSVRPRMTKPSGHSFDRVPVAHPDLLMLRQALQKRIGASSRSRNARPNSPLSPFLTTPPSRWAINWWP